MEWPRGEKKPTKCFLCGLPRHYTLGQLARIVKSRWKIQQGHQQLKEELGLDHCDVRSWEDWHNHVTLVMLAHAFLTLEMLRSQKILGGPCQRCAVRSNGYCSLGPGIARIMAAEFGKATEGHIVVVLANSVWSRASDLNRVDCGGVAERREPSQRSHSLHRCATRRKARLGPKGVMRASRQSSANLTSISAARRPVIHFGSDFNTKRLTYSPSGFLDFGNRKLTSS